MKLVTAVVRPNALDNIEVALAHAGVRGITVTEVEGYGRQQGHTEVYRGEEYTIDFLTKAKVEVLCADAEAPDIIRTITDAAHTGAVGDGKVWTTTVEDVIRIRTGERGEAAL